MELIYAGIGSRELELLSIPVLIAFAKRLSALGYTLRSGGAAGADTIFEENHSGPKEIYLPWKNFNKNPSSLYNISPEAKAMAKYYHPMGDALPGNIIPLMARNCYQVLGYDLKTPVDFVVCWTWDEYKGGTSQALRICRDHGIPYFNLKDPLKIYELEDLLEIIH